MPAPRKIVPKVADYGKSCRRNSTLKLSKSGTPESDRWQKARALLLFTNLTKPKIAELIAEEENIEKSVALELVKRVDNDICNKGEEFIRNARTKNMHRLDDIIIEAAESGDRNLLLKAIDLQNKMLGIYQTQAINIVSNSQEPVQVTFAR